MTAAVLLAAVPAVYFTAIAAAGSLLEWRTPVAPVDVIVVLGGDGPARATKAAAVYRSLASDGPRVLVSGDVDCYDIAKSMIDGGVPYDKITVECASRNTWENAKFSEPLLRRMNAHSAILVTSWFHIRRAIACFQAFDPQIRWGAAPVERHQSLWEIAWQAEGAEAAKEYLKLGWYALRYGIAMSVVAPIRSRRGAG